jgi:hypothetical protein
MYFGKQINIRDMYICANKFETRINPDFHRKLFFVETYTYVRTNIQESLKGRLPI